MRSCFWPAVILSLSLVHCVSSQKLQIQSTPNARVLLLNEEFQVVEEVGQTPLELNFREALATKDFVYLALTQEGYNDFRLSLPRNFDKAELNVTLTPFEKYAQAELKEKVLAEVQELTMRQVMLVLEVQKQLIERRFQDVHNTLTRLEALEPPAAVVALLRGNFHVLQGELGRALTYYRQVLEADPQNSELQEVITLLEKEVS